MTKRSVHMGFARRQALAGISGLALLAWCARMPPARAAAEEPAAAVVTAFRDGLAGLADPALDASGRAEGAGDLVDRMLALERIMATAVGTARLESWSAADRDEVRLAFRDYTAAVLGERAREIAFATLEIGGSRPGPGDGVVVGARLDDDVMNFLVVPGADAWRILDVVRDGISELAVRRAEFSVAAGEGPKVLVGRLRAQTAALLGGPTS